MSSSTSTHEDPKNWKLEHFDFVDTIGAGTFGKVKLAQHMVTGNYYACKVLRKDKIMKLKQVEHIMNEKKVLELLDSPFVVKLYRTFQDEDRIYIFMECIVGGELFSHLRKAGRFPNDVCKFFAAEIVLALENMHSKNIMYRDLKPENILLDTTGHIKVTDFGFAKLLEDGERAWTLCGTPEYLSPEIILSKGHGKPVGMNFFFNFKDWWALGILIYEMIVGYPPFFDQTPFKIYEKILVGKVEYPTFMDPNAKDLIKSLLMKDKSKRLGNLKGGVEDIKAHKWFKGVNWKALESLKIGAPIRPQVSGTDDLRYYDECADSLEYDEEEEDIDVEQDLFKDF